MELWIRSQDKMALCKCNNIYIDDEWVSPYYIKNGTLTLGKYSTKERALEVLDEIQNEIRPVYMLRPINNPDEPTRYEGYYEEKPTIVYEMPKE